MLSTQIPHLSKETCKREDNACPQLELRMLYFPSLSKCTGQPSLDMESTSTTPSAGLCTATRRYFLGCG